MFLVFGFIGFATIVYALSCSLGGRIPGPRKLPFLGNTLVLPKSHLWQWLELQYKKFGSVGKNHRILYPPYTPTGPIVSFSLAGDDYILLSQPADAEELLVKRSMNFSGRKQSIFAAKYRSNGKRMLLLPHGEDLKKQRSVFKLLLRPRALLSYHGRIWEEVCCLLFDLLNGPETYRKHVYHFTASLIMQITYGKRSHHGKTEDLDAILLSNESFNRDALPGAHLVDAFPWLDFLPDCVSPWRMEAKRKHVEELKLFQRLATQVKERKLRGDDSDSFMGQVWDCQSKYELDDETVAYLGGSAFEAGTSVTACMLHAFLLACVNYPAMVESVHEEIDRIMGDDIPQLEHLPKLPFLYAVVKETLRWAPVTPLAFPHKSEEDEEYKGFKIPAGTYIIPSIWNMHRDCDNFADAETFNPYRWYDPDSDGNVRPTESLVDGHWTFGFGRRQCPANYLAVEVIWGAIAGILWAFDIKKPGDPLLTVPVEVDRKTSWIDGVNIEPTTFPISITPRSEAHSEKIQSHWRTLNIL